MAAPQAQTQSRPAQSPGDDRDLVDAVIRGLHLDMHAVQLRFDRNVTPRITSVRDSKCHAPDCTRSYIQGGEDAVRVSQFQHRPWSAAS